MGPFAPASSLVFMQYYRALSLAKTDKMDSFKPCSGLREVCAL